MVNGKSLRNNDVEINHNLVVHNGLEAGDGILSATQNAVEVKLKPAASTESKDIPSKTHGIVASNDGYAAVGYAGNQVGFNSEKARDSIRFRTEQSDCRSRYSVCARS